VHAFCKLQVVPKAIDTSEAYLAKAGYTRQ
jgi:hypothetical protein